MPPLPEEACAREACAERSGCICGHAPTGERLGQLLRELLLLQQVVSLPRPGRKYLLHVRTRQARLEAACIPRQYNTHLTADCAPKTQSAHNKPLKVCRSQRRVSTRVTIKAVKSDHRHQQAEDKHSEVRYSGSTPDISAATLYCRYCAYSPKSPPGPSSTLSSG